MITSNPRYEAIFDPVNIDNDCDRIADMISDEGERIKEVLDAGMYTQAVTMYLQLLKSMTVHFIKDEHWCFFDDMYSPEYSLQWIYQQIAKHDLDDAAKKLLAEGHEEIKQCECYQEYGLPMYIHREGR